ncbi:MAG: winged helix-turn-helix domain-containing protein [Anaerolineae bacterium]
MSQASPAAQNGGRAADVAFTARCVQRGEHASIVGVNNMGKTAVLRAMTNLPDGPMAIYIDCNRVLEWTEVGFYELVIRAILDSLPSDSPCRPGAERAHATLVLASSHLEDAYAFVQSLGEVIQSLGRVALLLDELDDLLRRLDARVFLNLRALADQYGPSLTLITATSHRLPLLRADVEPFYELFSYRTRYLAPLNNDEAREYIRDYAAEAGCTVTLPLADFIHAQADGHPGLLRALTYLVAGLMEGEGQEDAAIVRRAEPALAFDQNVQAECAAIWNELFDDEREALAQVAAGQTPAEPANSYLRAKHLLWPAGTGDALLCPVFADFVARTRRVRPVGQNGLRVDTERGDVYVDGKAIPPLTDLEYRLLALLYKRHDQIVDKYQIVENVWGESYLDQVDDDRIERLVARLREKVEPDPRQPRFVTTVRGRGYRLRTE